MTSDQPRRRVLRPIVGGRYLYDRGAVATVWNGAYTPKTRRIGRPATARFATS